MLRGDNVYYAVRGLSVKTSFSKYYKWWCGTQSSTEPLLTKTNNVLLVFVTDNRLGGGGFEFAYEETEG